MFLADYFEFDSSYIFIFIGFMLLDSSLWTLEAPKTSYLLEGNFHLTLQKSEIITVIF